MDHVLDCVVNPRDLTRESSKRNLLSCNQMFCFATQIPRDPITLSDDEQGVYNHLLSKVFRFRCHSQKVIGSLGNENGFSKNSLFLTRASNCEIF